MENCSSAHAWAWNRARRDSSIEPAVSGLNDRGVSGPRSVDKEGLVHAAAERDGAERECDERGNQAEIETHRLRTRRAENNTVSSDGSRLLGMVHDVEQPSERITDVEALHARPEGGHRFF